MTPVGAVPDLAALAALGASGPVIGLEGHVPLAPVSGGPEWDRIRGLPRRDAEAVATSPVAQALEESLRAPGGTMRLRPDQLRALVEARAAGGLFAPIPVGGGKTLVASLLPTVLGKRAVVLTSAGLVAQAERMMAEYRHHYHIRGDLAWLSYGMLSSESGMDALERISPECIIADECQQLAHPSAARTRRFLRYMREHPSTIFCGMSGTVTRRGLRDFGHLLHLALRDQTPLPRSWPVLTEWAEAVDVSERPRPAGVLLELEPGATTARAAVQGRMAATPGVVVGGTGSTDLPLHIRLVDPPPSAWVEDAQRQLRLRWERPDGEQLTTAVEFARVRRQLALGGFWRWDWPGGVPDQDWMDARAAYRREMREWLQHHARRGLDSPLLVERAMARGEVTFQASAAWKATPPPPIRWRWVTDRMVRWAAAWAQAAPGIIWTDTPVVGQIVAHLAGVPWYGAGADISAARGDRSIVASIRAHGTGRNLQAFHRNLVLAGVPAGATWEQLLGRTHRVGQTAPTVAFDLPRTFAEDLDSALADAAYIQDTTGNPQKLLRATIARGEEA